MSKVEILELQHKIVDWKLRFGVAVFFALFFAVGFFFLIDANKDLNEQVESALDLSRSYENSLLVCERNLIPEVINGNLYIGYEDGVRVGYYKINDDWYRNGIKLSSFAKSEVEIE